MKKLLFSLLLAVASAFSINAQTSFWDFGDNTAWGPGASDANYQTISYTYDYNGLKFIEGSSGFTGFNTSSLTPIGDYTPKQRLAFGGNSYGGSTNPAVGTSGASALPTRRYIEVSVTGNSKITLWGRGGGARSLIIVNKGTSTVLANFAFSSSTDAQKFEYNYTGGSNTLIIASGAGDNSLYKIEVANTETMAVNDVRSNNKLNAFSSGNKIYVKDLESKNTQINVYSTNGTLVKSLKSSSDINFDINTKGIYIVNLKSEAGEKSVKVLIK
ncbi:T9SS type A sorting domain-containing protein [Epilithonimonas arachidiradicis]|uniref:Putative secreted protein (Por secretion system target) n=1 Tax=Epilithonimonas arachidiradicis TaxID=1617282 RepID=A0A420D7T4_9FLAO|nr:T9SS type A sorting domain-containing protein [Epilithonimonas arachidiradicis]RKE86758.1 putative secreted protein (Por secretion system target) [Epilithonimonas arachidiradicis]GGG62217.1 hypothetical protein GCM10007332_25260 [Epilithonimonas arachidiradicis]